MDRGAWWAAVPGAMTSQTRLSDFTFTFHFHALEKEMATHSSVLARRIPGMGEPGGLPSLGSHRVGHDWSDLAAAAAAARTPNIKSTLLARSKCAIWYCWVLMISRVYTFSQNYWVADMYNFLPVNHTSVKWFQKKSMKCINNMFHPKASNTKI